MHSEQVTVFWKLSGTHLSGMVHDGNAYDRSKAVYLKGYRQDRPFTGTIPSHGDVWRCTVAHDSHPEQFRRGALIVWLDAFLSCRFITACRSQLIVDRTALDMLAAQPDVLPLLPEVASRITFVRGRRGSNCVEVDLNRPLGRRMRLPAPVVEFNDPALFAQRIHRNKPSRVTLEQTDEVETTVLVRADRGRHDNVFFLRTAYIGRIAPREPWACNSEEELIRSVDFWSQHALVHDPRTMGTPFESTWEKIMEMPKAQKQL